MTNRKVIFTHETKDDFTTRSIEVVRHTYDSGDEYIFNIHEAFEQDINGETESLSSITLTHAEAWLLIGSMKHSLFSQDTKEITVESIDGFKFENQPVVTSFVMGVDWGGVPEKVIPLTPKTDETP